MPRNTSDDDLGRKWGKPDIERLGIFSEMSYMNGKGYRPIYPPMAAFKGDNLRNTGRKIRCGTQDGYFDEKFMRLFIGEAIPRSKAKKGAQTSITPFIVNSVAKKHSTPGDAFGTFAKQLSAFSPKATVAPYVREAPNFIWRCGKIGGPGYADTGIDKFPEYKPDVYGVELKGKSYGAILDGPFHYANYPEPYFHPKVYYEEPPSVGVYLDRERKGRGPLSGPWLPIGPSKWQGGSHAGCFDLFPEFKPCKYISAMDANQPRGVGKSDRDVPFMPVPQNLITMNTMSVMNHTVDIKLNTKNKHSYVPCYVKHLLDDSMF